MKKKFVDDNLLKRRLYKFLLFMAFKIFILFCTFSMAVASGHSQEKMNVDFNNETVVQVLEHLQMTTDYQFVYRRQLLSGLVVKEVKMKDASLREVLDEVLRKNGLDYTIVEDVVVIHPSNTSPQQKEFRIEGKVVDSKNEPLPGVTIRVDSTLVGAATRNDGTFLISLPVEKGYLIFSSVGFKQKRVPFEAGKTLLVVLEEDVSGLDEVVIRGYGTQKRREMISAISSIKAEDMKELPAASIVSMLQGRLAGLNIVNQSGAPGSAANVTIRGFNSLVDIISSAAGGSDGQPLYVVDGIPMYSFVSPQTGTNTLADLDPTMIESVDVLKDAAAASIYGSRAANGVILLTTKKGREGRNVFAANISYSISKMLEYPEQTGGRMERWIKTLWNRNVANTFYDSKMRQTVYPISYEHVYGTSGSYDWFWGNGTYGYYFPGYMAPRGMNPTWQDSLNPFYNNQTNWFKYATRTASVVNANVQVSGGSERIQYMIGAGYYNEKGIMLNSSYARANLLANLTVRATEALQVDTRFYLAYTDRSFNSGSRMHNGRYEGMTVDPKTKSTLLLAEGAVLDDWLKTINSMRSRTDDYRLMATFLLRYNILDGLTLSASGNLDYTQGNVNEFKPSTLDMYYHESESKGSGLRNISISNEELLNYHKTFNDVHNLDILLGLNINKQQEFLLSGSGRGGASDDIYYYPEDPGGTGVVGDEYGRYRSLTSYKSDFQEKVMIGYFGRIGYNYKQRYLAEFSFRRDGSSTFGENHRWADFPAVAVGWAFSDEPFLKERTSGWLDWGKIRLSWGKSGQIFDDAYLAHGLMLPGGSFNGRRGMFISTAIASGLTWEKSSQLDVGLDLDMFNYRLKIKLDYYNKRTKGLLYDVQVPMGIYPTSMQKRNAMDIINEGVELELEADIFRETTVKWRTKFNLSRNWNMLSGTYTGRDVDDIIIGRPIASLYVYDDTGEYYQNESEVPVYYSSSTSSLVYLGNRGMAYGVSGYVGTPATKDLDGNGQPGDMYYAGTPLPKVYGGWVNEVKWKDFDLNVLINISLARKMINMNDNSLTSGAPVFVDLRKKTFWEKEGDQTDYGRIGTFTGLLRSRIENVHNFSLKQITLGYNLPKRLAGKVRLKGARLFATGENIFYLSNYSGANPEVVNVYDGKDSGGAYPLPQKWTFGLTLNF